MKADHEIDILFSGDVFTLHVELEGKEIELFADPTGNTWKRQFPKFPVEGPLSLFVHTKGLNGTKWTLALKVDKRGPLKRDGIIKKGFSRIDEEIELPLLEKGEKGDAE